MCIHTFTVPAAAPPVGSAGALGGPRALPPRSLSLSESRVLHPTLVRAAPPHLRVCRVGPRGGEAAIPARPLPRPVFPDVAGDSSTSSSSSSSHGKQEKQEKNGNDHASLLLFPVLFFFSAFSLARPTLQSYFRFSAFSSFLTLDLCRSPRVACPGFSSYILGPGQRRPTRLTHRLWTFAGRSARPRWPFADSPRARHCEALLNTGEVGKHHNSLQNDTPDTKNTNSCTFV